MELPPSKFLIGQEVFPVTLVTVDKSVSTSCEKCKGTGVKLPVKKGVRFSSCDKCGGDGSTTLTHTYEEWQSHRPGVVVAVEATLRRIGRRFAKRPDTRYTVRTHNNDEYYRDKDLKATKKAAQDAVVRLNALLIADQLRGV